MLLPTATDDLLGSEKWALGPTGVILMQKGGWTYGILANHIRDVAGDDDRSDINNTFFVIFPKSEPCHYKRNQPIPGKRKNGRFLST